MRPAALLLVLGLLQAVPGPQGAAVPPAPQLAIGRGSIRAELYKPDPVSGYYRGTRFDWSGSIARLTWNGHDYFGQWFEKYDPRLHDAITGPVEEFSSVGYDTARPGESFVRIGVGAVRKPDEPAYRQFGAYDITNPGSWRVTAGASRIEFVHTLPATRGYAYVYRKVVWLSGNTMVLEHHLKNTGTEPIATTVYEHNFYMLDRQPTGPDFVVRFPFEATAARPLNGLAEARGRDVAFLKAFEPKQTIFTELTGYGASPRDYDIRVENTKTGAGVRQTSDRPLSKLVLWSAATTVCPEAFIDLRAAPGEETSWTITYEFYTLPATVASGQRQSPVTSRQSPVASNRSPVASSQ